MRLFLFVICLGFSGSFRYHSKVKPIQFTPKPILQFPKRGSNQVYQDIETNPDIARTKIAGQRWIVPGDFIVHREYGIGLYIGLKQIDLTPSRKLRTMEPMLIIKYHDGEIGWFRRLVEKELWLYRMAESGPQELSSILDNKKWKKASKQAEATGRTMAASLVKIMAFRNRFHRSPCPPDSDKYKLFESRFPYDPTDDQLTSFNAIKEDMIYRTRPMDRFTAKTHYDYNTSTPLIAKR